MNSLEAMAKVIETPKQLSVPYMLVGAFSRNAHGISRAALAISAKLLDWEYLKHWTKIHGTFDLLNQVREECPDLNLIDDE